MKKYCQLLLCFIFKIVWYKWTKNLKIIKVKGWRTALVEGHKISRYTMTPCFKIFSFEFD